MHAVSHTVLFEQSKFLSQKLGLVKTKPDHIFLREISGQRSNNWKNSFFWKYLEDD